MTYHLAPNAVFWTIQGEGAHLGEPMCFVRLAGCSVGCAGCDTNYTPYEVASVAEIVDRIAAVVPDGFKQPWVWITGGEPTDQDLMPLLDALRARPYNVALATSGVRNLPTAVALALNWISVSPHAPEFALRFGHEVKLVPGLGKLTWDNLPLRDCGSFPWKFIQPMPARAEADRGVEFIRNTPGWRLSPQAHKTWRIA